MKLDQLTTAAQEGYKHLIARPAKRAARAALSTLPGAPSIVSLGTRAAVIAGSAALIAGCAASDTEEGLGFPFDPEETASCSMLAPCPFIETETGQGNQFVAEGRDIRIGPDGEQHQVCDPSAPPVCLPNQNPNTDDCIVLCDDAVPLCDPVMSLPNDGATIPPHMWGYPVHSDDAAEAKLAMTEPHLYPVMLDVPDCGWGEAPEIVNGRITCDPIPQCETTFIFTRQVPNGEFGDTMISCSNNMELQPFESYPNTAESCFAKAAEKKDWLAGWGIITHPNFAGILCNNNPPTDASFPVIRVNRLAMPKCEPGKTPIKQDINLVFEASNANIFTCNSVFQMIYTEPATCDPMGS